MSAVEQLLLAFLKKEAASNPQLAGKLLQSVMQELKSNPAIVNDVITLVDDLLPVILSGVK